jgi:hypothetical protein
MTTFLRTENRSGTTSQRRSLTGLPYNPRLAIWDFMATAGPDTGPARIADPKGLRRLICRGLARRNQLFEWNGEKLTTVHYMKTAKAKTQRPFVSSVGRSRAYVEEQMSRLQEEEFHRGVSVSELLVATAQQIGISYATLHRITHGTSKTLDWRTIWLIQEYLGDTRERKLVLMYALKPETRRARQEYQSYVRRELRRLRQKRYPKHNVIPVGADRLLWDRFQSDALRLGADALRIRLGQIRVYDALIGWRRAWMGLGAEERKRLLRNGYNRELELIRIEHRHIH